MEDAPDGLVTYTLTTCWRSACSLSHDTDASCIFVDPTPSALVQFAVWPPAASTSQLSRR